MTVRKLSDEPREARFMIDVTDGLDSVRRSIKDIDKEMLNMATKKAKEKWVPGEPTNGEAKEAPKKGPKKVKKASEMTQKEKMDAVGNGAAKVAAKHKKKAEAAKSTEASDDGMITLSALCEELGIDSRKARVTLRKANGAQGTRYVWKDGSKDLAAARKILEAAAE